MATHASSTVVPFPLARADRPVNMPLEVWAAAHDGRAVDLRYERAMRPLERQEHELLLTVMHTLSLRMPKRQCDGLRRDMLALAGAWRYPDCRRFAAQLARLL